MPTYAEVAQLVEQSPEKRRVAGSSPALCTCSDLRREGYPLGPIPYDSAGDEARLISEYCKVQLLSAGLLSCQHGEDRRQGS